MHDAVFCTWHYCYMYCIVCRTRYCKAAFSGAATPKGSKHDCLLQLRFEKTSVQEERDGALPP